MTETAAASHDPLRVFIRSFGIFAVTVAVGPVVGALAVVGPFALLWDRNLQSLTDIASALLGVAIVGYAAGLTRATFVGLCIAYLAHRNGSVGYGQCVLAALGVTLLGTLYAFAAVGIGHPVAVLSVNAMMGLASVVAGLVCRWIVGRLGWLAH